MRLALLVLLLLPVVAIAQTPNFTRTDDVIYGRKFGTALTMDVFVPKEKQNGAAVIFCVSGGWFSSKESVNVGFVQEFLNRGYVCFAVLHGSQPKYSIPEVLEDQHRAVRYIRTNAKKYAIDPERLGISGASAGGHLSLMQGCAPKPGDPNAKDPVNKESSKVAAVACFFPPTDFMNYGKEGELAIGSGTLTNFKAPFDFTELDKKTKSFVLITDAAKRKEISKAISPITHVSKDSAPALILHGDKDVLVPLQQAESMIEKLKGAEVPCELVIKKGQAHGWATMGEDMKLLADWFDKHLETKKK